MTKTENANDGILAKVKKFHCNLSRLTFAWTSALVHRPRVLPGNWNKLHNVRRHLHPQLDTWRRQRSNGFRLWICWGMTKWNRIAVAMASNAQQKAKLVVCTMGILLKLRVSAGFASDANLRRLKFPANYWTKYLNIWMFEMLEMLECLNESKTMQRMKRNLHWLKRWGVLRRICLHRTMPEVLIVDAMEALWYPKIGWAAYVVNKPATSRAVPNSSIFLLLCFERQKWWRAME